MNRISLFACMVIMLGFNFSCALRNRCPMKVNLNAEQKEFLDCTESSNRDLLGMSKCNKLPPARMDKIEARCLEELHSKSNKKQLRAMNRLAAMGTDKAAGPLLELAMETKDNQIRWQAIRAIGMIGNDSEVGSLIHFVYHYNKNVRMWAQISLVGLTGQNFGSDWQAWGKWWKKQKGVNAFDETQIKWTLDNPACSSIPGAAPESTNIIVQENVGFDEVKLKLTNTEKVRSILGEPDSIKKSYEEFEIWNYNKNYGLELGFSKGTLVDIRLMGNFGGKLSSGITVNSTMDQVFSVYGPPETRQVKALSGSVPDKIYCVAGNHGKLRYYARGVTFWTRDDKIWWIHVSRF